MPPPVSTGDRIPLSSPRSAHAPSLLVPWLAVGVGLAALAALPDPSITDVAGAETLQSTTGGQSRQVQSFTSMLNETAVLAAQSSAATNSSETAIYLGVLAEAHRSAIENDHGGPGAPQVVTSIPEWTNRTFASAPTRRPNPSAERWAALRSCEASNDYAATNSSGKYRGAYQFDQRTWESVGGSGDPAAAAPEEQDLRAALLYQQRGASPWPFCGQYLDGTRA